MGAGHAIEPGRVPTEAYLRFVDEAVDHAIFFLDAEGRVASWNAGAQRMNGYAPAEIIGRHIGIFYATADHANKRPQYELRVAAAEGRHEDEGWRLRKDGSMFWANHILTPLKAPDGALLGYVKVVRDLTGRKHFEEALRQSEERYRLLIESVKDYAIFLLDPRGRVMSWNEGARRLKGYESDEIIGEHFSKFYRASDIERNHPAHELEIAVREGRYEEEGWRLRKDGSRFWANVTITTLRDASGRHVGFAKVTRDLTARKEVEEELRARAISYANLNKELDAFSQTVAHDIRSPVRAVEHLSSVLLEEEASRLSEDGMRSLRLIHETSLNMARLVQDLLELSTASVREPERADVDLTAIAREVANELREREPDRTIDVLVQDGLHASADGGLIRIALSNLIANAIKFTRKKERATIEVGAAQTKEGRAFYVRDNGAGFDPSRAAELFQPFARLHAVNDFEGTGIGLATVARIVQRHGGKVWAHGEPGEHATFYFTLGGSDR